MHPEESWPSGLRRWPEKPQFVLVHEPQVRILYSPPVLAQPANKKDPYGSFLLVLVHELSFFTAMNGYLYV